MNPAPEPLGDYLEIWKQEAEDFGLPLDIQKGLIFLVAWYVRVNGPQNSPQEWLAYTRKLSSKISLKHPHIRLEDAAGFNDTAIEELLSEFTHRFTPEFEPRIAKTEGGEFCVWKKPSAQRLPSCLQPNIYLLRDFEEIYTSLCAQIGKHLEGDDLEACYLAGFIFFDTYFPFDAKGTLEIARLLSSFQPPHFQWLCICLNVPADQIPLSNPVQKVLNSFLDASEGDLFRLSLVLSDTLHYSGPGQRNEPVWRATLPEYTALAACTRLELAPLAREQWFKDLQGRCQDKGFEPPPVCSSLQQAAEHVREVVLKRWGFDVRRGYASLKPGEQWSRRACVTFTCAVNAILRPDWNGDVRSDS
jgi:hypothetical protein